MNEEQIRAEFEAWYRDKFCKTLSGMATDEMMYIGSNGEYSSFHVRGAWEGWQAALSAKSVPEDLENEITIDRRDLFDFLRGKIKSVLDDYSNESEAANWSTATDLTVKAFENLHVSAPQVPTDDDRVREKSWLAESLAKFIYEQWSDKDGYVPWVEGGNSDMQEEARRQAIASLSSGEQG